MSQAKRRQKDMRGSTFNGFLLVSLGMVMGSVVTAMYLGYQSNGGSNTIGSGLRDFLATKTPKVLAEPPAESAPLAPAPRLEFHERLAENEVVMARVEPPVVAVDVTAPATTASGAVRSTTQIATVTPSNPSSAAEKADTPSSNIAQRRVALLQVGSFKDHADAERLKAKLALKGFTASIESGDIDGRKTWRVRLGPYATNDGSLDRVRRLLTDDGLKSLEIGVRQKQSVE